MITPVSLVELSLLFYMLFGSKTIYNTARILRPSDPDSFCQYPLSEEEKKTKEGQAGVLGTLKGLYWPILIDQ